MYLISWSSLYYVLVCCHVSIVFGYLLELLHIHNGYSEVHDLELVLHVLALTLGPLILTQILGFGMERFTNGPVSEFPLPEFTAGVLYAVVALALRLCLSRSRWCFSDEARPGEVGGGGGFGG